MQLWGAMEYSKIIKEVGRGKNHARDLDEETARAALRADAERRGAGAGLGILIALRIKGEGEAEMRRFLRRDAAACAAPDPAGRQSRADRYPQLQRRASEANLTPLLAMLLHKLGFPVVVHGVSHDPTRC